LVCFHLIADFEVIHCLLVIPPALTLRLDAAQALTGPELTDLIARHLTLTSTPTLPAVQSDHTRHFPPVAWRAAAGHKKGEQTAH
jgi:hypothetical protein